MNAPMSVNQAGRGASKPVSSDKVEIADPELVQRVLEGDQEAFRMLFDRYHQRAFAISIGVVKHRQDALDVVQDAFLKVHRHLDRFQGGSSFYTWFYRIVMNLSIDRVRKRQRATLVDYDDAIAKTDDQDAIDPSWLPTLLNADPARSVLRHELGEAIQSALDDLPEYHRAVLLLREVEGMTYEEIAEVQEVPKGTIMSRLFHARRKMQTALAPYLHGDLEIVEPALNSAKEKA